MVLTPLASNRSQRSSPGRLPMFSEFGGIERPDGLRISCDLSDVRVIRDHASIDIVRVGLSRVVGELGAVRAMRVFRSLVNAAPVTSACLIPTRLES